MRINHNISALRALHQLDKTNRALSGSLQRLSSGLRINSAADDAAGLAIVQKMDTQIRGLNQADRNASDGISLIQTAEGALSEVHSMLQRMRELSIQASNGTLSNKDRSACEEEVAQLKNEIDRISENIEFNDLKLLDGGADNIAFSSDQKAVAVTSTSANVMPGDYKFSVNASATKTKITGGTAGAFTSATTIPSTLAGEIVINGEKIKIDAGDTKSDVIGKISKVGDDLGISVSTSLTPDNSPITLTQDAYGPKDITITGNAALITGLGLNGTGGSTTTKGLDAQIDKTTLKGFPSDVYITVDGAEVKFQGKNGFEMKVEVGDGISAAKAMNISVLEAGPIELQIGANKGQNMQIKIPNTGVKSLGLDSLSVRNSEKAQSAVGLLDQAINQVSSVRSTLGAYQNRLEHTVSNLKVASENLTASMSRIQDADMAFEMAQYTQRNIISQSGISMLAQANERPQQLLQLLQR